MNEGPAIPGMIRVGRAAWHEAGHATCAAACGGIVGFVSIIPTAYRGGWACVPLDGLPWMSRLAILAAGFEGEMLSVPCEVEPAPPSTPKMVGTGADAFDASKRGVAAMLGEAFDADDATRLSDWDMLKDLIERMKTEMMWRTPLPRIWNLRERAHQHAARILRRHFAPLKALACDLQRHQALTGDDVREILSGAGLTVHGFLSDPAGVTGAGGAAEGTP